MTIGLVNRENRYRDRSSNAPLYGIFAVEQFIAKGQVVPPLATDPNRWNKVIFDARSAQTVPGLTVLMMNGRQRYFDTEYDTVHKVINLSSGQVKSGVVSYAQSDSKHLTLQGVLMNDPVIINLKKIDESRFPLLRTTFRWIYDE
jgi:hypothetical protein